MRLMDLTGEVFGPLTVLRRGEGPVSSRQAHWECLCECGKTITKSSRYIRKGSGHCGCSERPSPNTLPNDESLWRRAVNGYKGNARTRGIEWSLDEGVAISLMQSDCHYCKAPPSNIERGTSGRTILRSGIDRVDNTQGYTSVNVVSCCADCNMAKGRKTTQQFLEWLHRAARFTQEPEFKLSSLTERDVVRHPVIEEVLDLYGSEV